MRPALLLFTLFFISLNCRSQFYLRGTVNDEAGKGIYNVKITLASKGSMPFYSGTSGAFGIPVSVVTDSITITADGYESLHAFADTRKFQVLVLKNLPLSLQ